MKPVDMIVRHDPENGAWGDCTRACIASIFDLPPEDVPHFASFGVEHPRDDGILPWIKRLQEWLTPRGFYAMFARIDGPECHWHQESMQFHYLLGGKTLRGTEHDVVAFAGKMVHDPHPDRTGLTQEYPMYYTIFVKR
jgi:hypothetical protein